MKHFRLRPFAAFAALLVLLLPMIPGCSMEGGPDQMKTVVREWYPSRDILIPISFNDDRMHYAEYSYEYDVGTGWIVADERTLRFSGWEEGLIRFTAADPQWHHRVTISTLDRSGPGQPLEAFGTTERYFGIDTTVPSADPATLQVKVFQDGTEVAGPPYDGAKRLEFALEHPEFGAPSGSPIGIHLVRVDPYNSYDPAIPAEDDWKYNEGDFVWVWGDFGGPHDEYFRLIVVDSAGNRSAVRELQFSSP